MCHQDVLITMDPYGMSSPHNIYIFNFFADRFPVAIIDNADSIDLGITAYYFLKVSLVCLSLLDLNTHMTVEQWPLRQIERFSIPATLEEDRNHLFSIHVVR